jgi:Ca2+-binding RTX toxin-like protein
VGQLGWGFRCASALAACAAALAWAPAANALVTCTYDNSDRVTVTMSADGDSTIVAVQPGGAIAVRGGGPVLSCAGAGGPPTVTNTDFVIVNDTSGGGDTRVSIHEPTSFAPGLTLTGESGSPEIEFVIAPGTGNNDTLFVSGTAGPDNWVLGATGFNWNAATDADSEFFATSPSVFDEILLSAGDGDDVITAQGGTGVGGPFSAATFLELSGDGGGDTLSGSNNAGDLLRGADGNDSISGFDGDDQIVTEVGDDTAAGGPGTDTLNYLASFVPVTIDLSQTGAQATGQGTDTLATIENVLGSQFSDTLIGDSSANVLNGATGDNTFDGREGPDELSGSIGVDTVTYAQAPAGVAANLTTGVASGGFGDDTLAGIDNLVGSPFADTLTGSATANLITGLGGVDTISALAGADVVNVRDGGRDTASCGSESDTATADQSTLDAVNADCESVAFLPGAGGGGGGGGGGATDTVLSVRFSIDRTQRALKRGGLIVKVRCPREDCKVVAGARLNRLKLKRVTRQVRAGVTRTLKLRFTKRQRRILRTRLAAGRHPVLQVTARATDAAGNRVTRIRRVKTKA